MAVAECPVCGHNDLWDSGGGCHACELAGRPRTRMVSVRYPTRRDLHHTPDGQKRLFAATPIWFEPESHYGFPIPGMVL